MKPKSNACKKLIKERMFNIEKVKAEIAILEQAIAEIKNIQSQQKTFKTSQNDRQGTVQTLVSGDEEVGVNSQFLRDNADTPQEKVSEVRIKALFPNIEKSPVVSNLLQKQRQEEIKFLEELTWVIVTPNLKKLVYNRIEQLNQPKTEK
jgi:hypothetical protein